MARLTDALMANQAFSRGHEHPLLNLSYGGQMGYSTQYAEWASTTHYVRKNVIALLLELPKFIQLMPDSEFWAAAIKAMVEVHPLTWDGLKSTLSVETQTTPFGGAGEEFDDYVKTKREKSTPTSTYKDLYGRPMQNLLSDWIIYGLADPETNVPMAVTLAGKQAPSDWLADMYSMSVIFIEPDPTHTKVSKAWLCTNMYPKTSGPIEGKRDVTAAGELLEISVEWTAITQTGHGVMAFAKTLLDAINKALPNANPLVRKSFIQSVAPDVAAVGTTGGAYGSQLAQVSADMVMPS